MDVSIHVKHSVSSEAIGFRSEGSRRLQIVRNHSAFFVHKKDGKPIFPDGFFRFSRWDRI